jgi:L-arabinose isomerase
MPETQKAKVGLVGLMFKLYDSNPELKSAMAQFGLELAGTLSPFADVDFPGVCNTREQVDQAIARFEADGKDLVIVVLLTYAPSHIALPALLRTRLPILIYNTQQLHAITQDTPPGETTKNHGMHGVQDLTNVLLRLGRSFHLVTGHYKDKRTIAEVRLWCDAVRTVRFMRHMRIGLVGYPMEGMGDFALDETALLGQAGVTVERIPMQVIAERAQSAPLAEISRQMGADRENFRFQADITPEQHEASSRLEWAIRDILRERGLHGFASHFVAVSEDGRLDTLPFLAASKLLAEGYGFGGEGDVTSAAAVAMMRGLTGAANFTEMFTMDPAGNSVLMMHMGEANWKMARADEPIWMLQSNMRLVDLRFPPLVLAFSLQPGDITLVSLTTVANGKLKFIATEGQVADMPYIRAMSRPHYKFAPEGDLSDFLTRYSLAGGSHHLALAYGRWASALERIAALLGVEYTRV